MMTPEMDYTSQNPPAKYSTIGFSNISNHKSYVLRIFIAEFLGTFLLVSTNIASTVEWPNFHPTVMEKGLTPGLIVPCLIQSLGHISGCHINPAVTISFLVSESISFLIAVLYIIAQLAGAVCGAAVIKNLIPANLIGNLGNTELAESLCVSQGFFIETLITFTLVIFIHSISDESRTDVHGSIPLGVGLTVLGCQFLAVDFTGASMNPARSFGPAVIQGFWINHWVYWAAPLTGAVIASGLYNFVLKHS